MVFILVRNDYITTVNLHNFSVFWWKILRAQYPAYPLFLLTR